MAGGGTVGCDIFDCDTFGSDTFGSDTFSGETVVGDNEVGGNVPGNVVNAAAVGAVVGGTVIGVAVIGGGTLVAGDVVVKGADPAGKASGCGNGGGAREDDEAPVCGAIGGRPLIGGAVGGIVIGERPVVGNAVGVGSTGASEICGRRLETLSSLAVDVAASLGGGDTGCAVGWIGGNGISAGAVELPDELLLAEFGSAVAGVRSSAFDRESAAMPNGTSAESSTTIGNHFRGPFRPLRTSTK